jgi:hypothetical protein
VARPTLLTRARHERIVELLREGVPFATACRRVGISSSAGYEWLHRGWGKHPSRPTTQACVAFARDVDAVFPGGFAERYADDEIADEEGGAGFAEFAAPGFSDAVPNARAREDERQEPVARTAPLVWESKSTRAERGLADYDF